MAIAMVQEFEHPGLIGGELAGLRIRLPLGRGIPEEERDAAIAELRQMGVEMKKSQGDEKIQRAVVRNWRRISGDQQHGHVAAGNHEHQTYHGHQDLERFFNSFAQPRDAARR